MQHSVNMKVLLFLLINAGRFGATSSVADSCCSNGFSKMKKVVVG